MYEIIGDYCFDLNRDEYINDKNEVLNIYSKNNFWYAEFKTGVNIVAATEKELVSKIEKICKGENYA